MAPETHLPRHILCGLDAEGHARDAVAVATWLSERLDAELEFIHAFPPRPVLWGKREAMPEWVAGTEITGRVLREELREAMRGAPPALGLKTSADALRLHVTSGHAAHVILERARAASADLIVLGPHAKHGALDLDDTARAVLAHASGGVWVQSGRPRPIKRILVPIDLSENSLRALALARDLARAFGARITALQAFEPPTLGASGPEVAGTGYVVEHYEAAEREAFDAAVGGFDWNGVTHATLFEHGDPAERVLAHQAEHDLVVLGTHGRTGLSAVLLGSVAHSVLRSATIPVLALRQKKGTYLL
jgi:nucleotide-binding universal stress UspA family protein